MSKRVNNGSASPRRCEASGKIAYDKKGAQSAKNLVHRRGKGEMRFYHCPDCNLWHLSHQSRSVWRDKNRSDG